MLGNAKIKLRPEELQKVTGERGRRGTLMRGLQRIDRVEIDSPRRASSGDSEVICRGGRCFLPLARNAG